MENLKTFEQYGDAEYTYTIVIEQRLHDYKAYLKGQNQIWNCGKTKWEAVGRLLLAYPGSFDIKIEE